MVKNFEEDYEVILRHFKKRIILSFCFQMKTSLFEGGVRGVAVVWSPYLKRNECVTEELFHISDWLPTFISAAGIYIFTVYMYHLK